MLTELQKNYLYNLYAKHVQQEWAERTGYPHINIDYPDRDGRAEKSLKAKGYIAEVKSKNGWGKVEILTEDGLIVAKGLVGAEVEEKLYQAWADERTEEYFDLVLKDKLAERSVRLSYVRDGVVCARFVSFNCEVFCYSDAREHSVNIHVKGHDFDPEFIAKIQSAYEKASWVHAMLFSFRR